MYVPVPGISQDDHDRWRALFALLADKSGQAQFARSVVPNLSSLNAIASPDFRLMVTPKSRYAMVNIQVWRTDVPDWAETVLAEVRAL